MTKNRLSALWVALCVAGWPILASSLAWSAGQPAASQTWEKFSPAVQARALRLNAQAPHTVTYYERGQPRTDWRRTSPLAIARRLAAQEEMERRAYLEQAMRPPCKYIKW